MCLKAAMCASYTHFRFLLHVRALSYTCVRVLMQGFLAALAGMHSTTGNVPAGALFKSSIIQLQAIWAAPRDASPAQQRPIVSKDPIPEVRLSTYSNSNSGNTTLALSAGSGLAPACVAATKDIAPLLPGMDPLFGIEAVLPCGSETDFVCPSNFCCANGPNVTWQGKQALQCTRSIAACRVSNSTNPELTVLWDE